MNRSTVAPLLALALALLGAAPPASATTDPCRPRPGEHQLARSTRAVVLARDVAEGRQAIAGCSRRSGHRRSIATAAISELRLAGTRIAYATPAGVMADDAVHGGRHHDLTDPRPFASDRAGMRRLAIDDQGDVAWTTASGRTLMAYRGGLGSRLIDGRAATIDGLSLRAGVLRWRRNHSVRSVDLKRVQRSACPERSPRGTLVFDADPANDVLCMRADGRVIPLGSALLAPMDANEHYAVFTWVHVEIYGADLVDLDHGTVTTIDQTVPGLDDQTPAHMALRPTDVVVDEHGSVAWIAGGVLKVRDAAGTRTVPGTGTGPLLRDGSTVTWSGGGPSVTLNP
jgi:hypothetical protein